MIGHGDAAETALVGGLRDLGQGGAQSSGAAVPDVVVELQREFHKRYLSLLMTGGRPDLRRGLAFARSGSGSGGWPSPHPCRGQRRPWASLRTPCTGPGP